MAADVARLSQQSARCGDRPVDRVRIDRVGLVGRDRVVAEPADNGVSLAAVVDVDDVVAGVAGYVAGRLAAVNDVLARTAPQLVASVSPEAPRPTKTMPA